MRQTIFQRDANYQARQHLDPRCHGFYRAAAGVAVFSVGSRGEVSFYRSVGKAGSGDEIQLIKPKDLWHGHASYIAG